MIVGHVTLTRAQRAAVYVLTRHYPEPAVIVQRPGRAVLVEMTASGPAWIVSASGGVERA